MICSCSVSAGVLTKLNHWQVMKKISTFDFFDAPLTPYANTTPLPMHCAPKGFPVEIPVAKVESEAPVWMLALKEGRDCCGTGHQVLRSVCSLLVMRKDEPCHY